MMRISLTEPLDKNLWLSAMHSEDADELLSERMDEAERLLFDAAAPKGVYRVMDEKDVRRAGYSIEKHLEGCYKIVVMGVTLGIGVDDLLRKVQVQDMAMAVILDCGASVMVEMACDVFQRKISAEVNGYLTPRFSPGYGDFPIEYQKYIVRYIDGQRKIGLTVTENSLMVPRKSVTALMGIADHPVTGRLATCEECVLREKCTLRREGRTCGN